MLLKKEILENNRILKEKNKELKDEIERLKSLWETDRQSWNELMAEKETEIERLKNIPNKIKEYLKQVHIETQSGILSSNNLIWENIERLCDRKNIIGSDKE